MSAPDDIVIGLDLGTSALKAVAMDASGRLLAEAQTPLEVSRPQPSWSEQNPDDWWVATDAAVSALRARTEPAAWRRVRALAVAGQMHGAVLLGRNDQLLRPAILWNDGRSQSQCEQLEAREPGTRRITLNRAMAGFTAPKLLWLAEHEPAVRDRVASVLLPKDWLVMRLTGEKSTDCSDAAGTLWLDVAARRWSPAMLAATGLSAEQLPAVHESADRAGELHAKVARRWGLPAGLPVAAGAGDNAAAAIGLGVVAPGDGFISLGTSGVLFVCTATARGNPDHGVHTFCHARPDTWHQMAVLLSAASALGWWASVCGVEVGELLAALTPGEAPARVPLFLPYLSGERTPHADPAACGAFIGLRAGDSRAAMTYAVLEGVAFAFADGLAALTEAGARPVSLLTTGGGARSDAWLQLMADVLQRPLDRPRSAEVGPAIGAARLALLSLGHAPEVVLTHPALERRFEPSARHAGWLADRLQRFREAYRPLRMLC